MQTLLRLVGQIEDLEKVWEALESVETENQPFLERQVSLTGLARKVGDAKSRRQRFGGNPRENEGR